MNHAYAAVEPTRSEIDALPGWTLLEFGAPWCEYCRAVQPLLAAALAAHPEMRHFKIEDGRGRSLGRSFRIKLWPTLLLVRDGQEMARLVRPESSGLIAQMLAGIGSERPTQ